MIVRSADYTEKLASCSLNVSKQKRAQEYLYVFGVHVEHFI